MGLIGLEHGVDSSAPFVVGTCNPGNMLKPAPDCYVLRNDRVTVDQRTHGVTDHFPVFAIQLNI